MSNILQYRDDKNIFKIISPGLLHSITLSKHVIECVRVFTSWWSICLDIYISHPVLRHGSVIDKNSKISNIHIEKYCFYLSQNFNDPKNICKLV